MPLLIALISDNVDIHRDAAGALWSLAADEANRKLIADEGGIPELVKLLKVGQKTNLAAQETAAGALHSLAMRPENRDLIADAGEGGIGLLVPLLETGTELAKAEVTGALLTLVIDNPSNQFVILSKLVAVLQMGPADVKEVDERDSRQMARVEAQEHATNVIYHLTQHIEHKEAFNRLSAERKEEKNIFFQLVRLLKGGSERARSSRPRPSRRLLCSRRIFAPMLPSGS